MIIEQTTGILYQFSLRNTAYGLRSGLPQLLRLMGDRKVAAVLGHSAEHSHLNARRQAAANTQTDRGRTPRLCKSTCGSTITVWKSLLYRIIHIEVTDPCRHQKVQVHTTNFS